MEFIASLTEYRDLEHLMESIMEGETPLVDGHPSFGGMPPDDVPDVISWDETRLLVGKSIPEMRIVQRPDTPPGCLS